MGGAAVGFWVSRGSPLNLNPNPNSYPSPAPMTLRSLGGPFFRRRPGQRTECWESHAKRVATGQSRLRTHNEAQHKAAALRENSSSELG